jgi:phosphonate transport system substrate-binding protein
MTVLRAFVMVVALLAAAGCGTQTRDGGAAVVQANTSPTLAPDAHPPGMPAVPASPGHVKSAKLLRIGRIPYRTAQTVFSESEALFARLAAPLGYDGVLVETARDYDSVLTMLAAGHVELAWLGAATYARARLAARKPGARKAPVPVAMPVRHGRAFYHGTIIARKDSGFRSLSDLKGKRVAFVDPESASGSVIPRLLLENAGVKVPDALKTEEPGSPDFLRRHDSVVAAVYLRKFDAGAVYDGAPEAVFASEPEKANELVVLARSGRIFNEPIVVRADAPQEFKDAVQRALLSLAISEATGKRSGGLERFVAAAEENYRELESMLEGAP